MNKKAIIALSISAASLVAIGVAVFIGISVSNNKKNKTLQPSNTDPLENLFTWSGDQITGLTDLGKQQTNIVLPARATSIANNVFANNEKIESVDMSLTGITEIPNGDIIDAKDGIVSSFLSNCEKLTSVKLPKNLTSIGNYTFMYSINLTSVTLPDTLTSIGDMTFYYCTSLTSIDIPNGVTSIGDAVFDTCSSLTSINIPSSLTDIPNSAFYACRGITSITIPEGVTSIGDSAFQLCTSLREIYIPKTLTSIGTFVFHETDTSQITIYVPDEQTKETAEKLFGSGFKAIEIANSNTQSF